MPYTDVIYIAIYRCHIHIAIYRCHIHIAIYRCHIQMSYTHSHIDRYMANIQQIRLLLPLEDERRRSGDSGEVAMEVTHPECPLSVPRNANVSILMM